MCREVRNVLEAQACVQMSDMCHGSDIFNWVRDV